MQEQNTAPLSFYEHARQSYGALPIEGKDTHQWHVGGYSNEGGVDERGEFRLGLWINRAREPWQRDRAFVKLTAYPDAAGALTAFIAAGGMEALEGAQSPDDVTAALLSCGLLDRSEYTERVQSCPCCIGQGKVKAEDAAAVRSVLDDVKREGVPYGVRADREGSKPE